MKTLLIVGGGITGLAAAYIAAKQGVKVTVLEASAKIGGLLQTTDAGENLPARIVDNGFNRLEYFYHHHFRDDLEFQWLLKELGILSKLKFYPTKMGVYREGEIYPFNKPSDLFGFSPISFFDKLRFAFSSLYLAHFCDWKKHEEVSCLDWFRENSGKSTVESLWEPMLRIKFGDYADQVPLSWMIGRLRQRVLSRKGSQEMLGYLDGSLNALLVALDKKLFELGVVILTEVAADSLIVKEGKVIGVKTKHDNFVADTVLFTTPTNILAPLVQPHHAVYAQTLANIEYFGALCVVVETSQALSDVYWLNVADDGFPFGGVIEHTNLVPKENFGGRHISYLSRYFPLTHPLATEKEEEIIEAFTQSLRRLFPNLKAEEILRVRCFRTHTAATVCGLNFSQSVPRFDSPLENLYVASMAHIYPDERSCNNSIRVAANTLHRMGLDTSFVPQGLTLAGLTG